MSFKIKPDEITSVISRLIGESPTTATVREVGRVLEVGDGIARCYGLSEVGHHSG
jgi:F-type H+/Na+-transporting ATPase subunit alpha